MVSGRSRNLLARRNKSSLLIGLILMPVVCLTMLTEVGITQESASEVLVDKTFKVQGMTQAWLGNRQEELQPLYDIENQHLFSHIDRNDGANNFSLVVTDFVDAVNAYKSNLSTRENKAGLEFDRKRGNYGPLIRMFMVQYHPWNAEFDGHRDTCLAFRRLGQVNGTPPPIGYEESLNLQNLEFTLTILDYELDEKWRHFQADAPRQFGYKWIKIHFTAEVKTGG